MKRHNPFVSHLGRHPEVVLYTVLAWMLWLVPVFDRLHVESGAVVASVAFFTSGLGMLRRKCDGARLQFVYPLVAAAWLTVSMLWAPNCDYLRGAVLFATFVFPSVALGVAMAVFVHVRAGGRRWILVASGLLIMVIGPVYDLGFHPQFYTYNHVFGGVLGPIYDDELVIRPGVFLFRLFTFVWAGLLVGLALGRWRLVGATALLLAVGYSQAGPLGINTPQTYLEEQFSERTSGDGYELFFYSAQVTDSLARDMRDEMDWHMHRLDSLLGVRPSGRVRVYAWPSADERARRTGARYTSVAPVWLGVPQIHVVADQFSRFASHELVHVFSREFGLPVIRASTMAGLVEGLAVALESPNGGAPADHLVAAAAGQEADFSRGVERALTPAGFWTGRGAVSYTTTGSFVAWLGRTYGVERLKQVYARADFERVYGKDVGDLVNEWQLYLAQIPVLARTAGPEARRSFSRLSLFEQQCPHYVPPRVRALRLALQADSHEALQAVVAEWPDYVSARLALAGALADVLSDTLTADGAARREAAAAVQAILHPIPRERRNALWYELAARAAQAMESERAASLVQESIWRTRVDYRRERTRRGLLLDATGGSVPSGLASEINAYKKWAQSRMFYASGDIEAARGRAREARFLYVEMGDVAMVPVLDEWIQRTTWRLTADIR